jgi:hypothetical protein
MESGRPHTGHSWMILRDRDIVRFILDRRETDNRPRCGPSDCIPLQVLWKGRPVESASMVGGGETCHGAPVVSIRCSGKEGSKIVSQVPKSLWGKQMGWLGGKHSSNPSKAVRSDRIHAVYRGIPLPGPDESGHYEWVKRMSPLGAGKGMRLGAARGRGLVHATRHACRNGRVGYGASTTDTRWCDRDVWPVRWCNGSRGNSRFGTPSR